MTPEERQTWNASDLPLFSGDQLAIFLAGDPFGFTSELLRAIAKAGKADRAKLWHVYPREVRAWELWQAAAEPPTAGELAELLEQELAALADDARAEANCVMLEGGGMLIRDIPAPGVSS